MTAKQRILAILDDQPDDSTFGELLRALAEDAEPVDADQIAARLRWSPRERLQYLLDMLAFEERAHLARKTTAGPQQSSR